MNQFMRRTGLNATLAVTNAITACLLVTIVAIEARVEDTIAPYPAVADFGASDMQRDFGLTRISSWKIGDYAPRQLLQDIVAYNAKQQGSAPANEARSTSYSVILLIDCHTGLLVDYLKALATASEQNKQAHFGVVLHTASFKDSARLIRLYESMARVPILVNPGAGSGAPSRGAPTIVIVAPSSRIVQEYQLTAPCGVEIISASTDHVQEP